MKKAHQIGTILSLVVTALIPLNTNASLFHFNDSRFVIDYTLSPHLGGMASNAEFNGKYLIVGETYKIPSAHGAFDLFRKHALLVVDIDSQFLDSSAFSRYRNETKFKGVIPDTANFLTHEKIDLSLHVLTNPTFYSDIGLSLSPVGLTKGATSNNLTKTP